VLVDGRVALALGPVGFDVADAVRVTLVVDGLVQRLGRASLGISVMSPQHLRFGAGAVKSRLSRSGNFGAVRSWRVNPLLRLGFLPCRPCRRIESATVFTLTVHPASTRSAWMRGESYVRFDSTNNRKTSASSSARRRCRTVAGRSSHLCSQETPNPRIAQHTAYGTR
jgi:hypothetical protein